MFVNKTPYRAIRHLLRMLLPRPLHIRLRSALGRIVLSQVLGKVRHEPSLLLTNSDAIDWAYYGWGSGWAASADFLRAAPTYANATRGHILECGSGLSTILLGCVLQPTQRRMISLEHDSAYAARVQRLLNRYGLCCVKLCVTPLRRYEGYDWYAIPIDVPHSSFDLVICDGPPGDTLGGRYGLIPQMKQHLNSPSVILLDDAARKSERDTLLRWQSELACSISVVSCGRPYAVIELP